ncbi:MAG: hypothetical protein U9N82_06550 [Thermodesulfobacteriota bacterium]|nr:hypothetical protein [Thermodesulfobacteriota bacterium]
MAMYDCACYGPGYRHSGQVTQRAAGKEPLFLEDPDYLYMLVLLKEISRKHAIRIYAFCYMENHTSY